MAGLDHRRVERLVHHRSIRIGDDLDGLRHRTDPVTGGQLLPDDVTSSTFTVTNLATVSGGWFMGTPIINQPQSAILAVGGVSDRAVVRDGQVVVRAMLPFSLTFDHRVIDGAPAARFAARLAELFQEPTLLLV